MIKSEVAPYTTILRAAFMSSDPEQGLSDVERTYREIPGRRRREGDSLGGNRPGGFQQEITAFVKGVSGQHKQYYLLDALSENPDRATGADVLVWTMSEYIQTLPDEIVEETIGQGVDMFHRLTGFDSNNVSEPELLHLLPNSFYPRRVTLLGFLLDIRRDFIDAYTEGSSTLMYEGSRIREDLAKAKILRHGLQIAAAQKEKKDVLVKDKEENSTRFTLSQTREAFQALTKYNLDVDIHEPYEQNS